ncbi:MAG: endonuclease/exonuclease/phosphatase family protein [Alistipes sp.]|nr:endonuclease/exonuclease/phosphatase family protein [Alistipes sp.]
MKKRVIFTGVLLLVCAACCFAQKPYKVVFYNLENFFDTINDPETHDDEFTPEGSKKWTEAKYGKKLSNIERVLFDIAAIDREYPAVIGVSEVENRSVLEDIVSTPRMLPGNYRIVHYDSPDPRGVDVAFLYRPDVFKLEGSEAIRTEIPGLPNFRTRDIVTMWGTIEEEPFYFMVAHWPSRLGGKEASAPRREAVGAQMRRIADSVRAANPAIKIVAMGDFNDDPTDASILESLGAKAKMKELQEGDFFNPYYAMLRAGMGTLAYGDAWNIFDNIVVSENLAAGEQEGLKLLQSPNSKFYGNIFRQNYMIQKSGRFKGYPLRTFVGNAFQGGYSDHFPVFIYIGK